MPRHSGVFTQTKLRRKKLGSRKLAKQNPGERLYRNINLEQHTTNLK